MQLTSVFELSDDLAAKADPALIADDERHFAAIAEALEQTTADLSDRLEDARRAPVESSTAALERDQEVHRLTARLRTLRRFGVDLCLGHMVGADDGEAVYVGRLGLTDSAGRRLLVDWRSPAAEPFFGATHANPMGLASRRRYRWTLGRIRDYWDEVFTADGFGGHAAALDDQSAFIASLGTSRSPRMRDVLGTIQADQDAIIRAGSRGALVVDGGPGTGKTVVALHRTAYLLYSDPRLGHRRGGVLFVGPHQPYLAYVGDVLPSLGEEGVQTCTLRDLLPEGAAAAIETDPDVARLKSSAEMVTAIEPAVRLYEEPPSEGMVVETPWSDVWLSSDDWAEAFESPAPGTPHNEARDQVWEELLTILADKHDDDDDASADLIRTALARNTDLLEAFGKAWPLIEPTDLVGDLWSVPAYLRLCAPWLDPDEVRLLQRRDSPHAWTVSDLPLLDAARQRLGDPEASRRRRRHEAAVAAERERDDPGRRPPDRDRRLRPPGDVDAAWPGPARCPGRRGRHADDRPRPARRSVRPHRRGRGPGADRRRVADAPAPLPLAQPHHRRGPCAGPARVHRVVAGTPRTGRARPRQPRVAEHQLPDARRGHGGGRAGHPGGPPGRQRADLGPQQRRTRRARIHLRPALDPRLLARRACRGARLRDRRRRDRRRRASPRRRASGH